MLQNAFFKFGVRLVIVLVACYFALLLYLYLSQRNLIFRGSTIKSHLELSMVNGPGAQIHRVLLPDNLTCSLLFAPALREDGTIAPKFGSHPYVLFFYGNGSSITSSLTLVQNLRLRGLNVCVPDYPGYGDSQGSASEQGNYAAATAAYDFLRTVQRVPPHKIVIMGWSLGAAAAIDLAVREPHAALITCGAFTSMTEMCEHLYPLFPAPVLNAILKYPFDNIDKMPRIRGPVLIVHGLQDHYIPYRYSDRLAAACGGTVTRYSVQSGMHDQLFEMGGPALYDTIAGFCKIHAG